MQQFLRGILMHILSFGGLMEIQGREMDDLFFLH